MHLKIVAVVLLCLVPPSLGKRPWWVPTKGGRGGSTPASTSEQPRLFIIDTDPGGDDASALMYALARKRESDKILALTVNPGNGATDLCAKNTWRVLKLMGRTDIPIHMGAQRRVLYADESDGFFGHDSFGDQPDVYPKWEESEWEAIQKRQNAIPLIVDLVRKYPGEITMIALGSLTNLAAAFMIEPKLPELLKETYIMGGNIHAEGNVAAAAEFNFWADPEAAKVVVENFHPTMCPLELLSDFVIDWEWHDKWLSADTKRAQFLKAVETVSNRKQKEWGEDYFFVDQACVAIALNPELATEIKERHAVVELDGQHTRGMMVVDWRGGSKATPNVQIVTHYDSNYVKKDFWKLVRED